MLAVYREAVVSAPSARWNALTVDAPYGFHNVRFGNKCRDHVALGSYQVKDQG